MFGFGKEELPKEDDFVGAEEIVLETKEEEKGSEVTIVEGADGEAGSERTVETTPAGGEEVDGEKLSLEGEASNDENNPYEQAA